ncbi:MAG: hypothetical protein D3923_13670 [Candidatus Electrothrix sp. AR3]|nr:hypothetical protein [Candidatus Electrothrix sp. AR3]
MYRMSKNLLILFCFLLLFNGCGYYFPNVYDVPEVSVYMPTWKNRTNKLGIDNLMYQSLAAWFQKADKIHITRDRESADMVLAGEIISMELPGIGWNTDARITDVKVALHLRYILKDLESGKILWEIPNDIWTEDYNTLAEKADTEDEAIEQILDEVSEKIYLGTISRIRKMHRKKIVQ